MTPVDFAAWLAAGFLAVRGFCALNAMTWRTVLPYKLAKIAMTLAAAFVAIAPLYGIPTAEFAQPFLVVCVALVLACDRRERVAKHTRTAQTLP